VRGSGFEDIVFQSGICTSGSLGGVLAGSHYNRAWVVHKVMCEALERILFSRFKAEMKPKLSDEIINYLSEDEAFLSFESTACVEELVTEYARFKDMVRGIAIKYLF